MIGQRVHASAVEGYRIPQRQHGQDNRIAWVENSNRGCPRRAGLFNRQSGSRQKLNHCETSVLSAIKATP